MLPGIWLCVEEGIRLGLTNGLWLGYELDFSLDLADGS
jgi:hypothetical protein